MDIKVYDYVIDPVTIEQTFQFLSKTFYSFGSTSDDMVASDVSWVRNHKGCLLYTSPSPRD